MGVSVDHIVGYQTLQSAEGAGQWTEVAGALGVEARRGRPRAWGGGRGPPAVAGTAGRQVGGDPAGRQGTCLL